jgi:hypothetical protein
MLCAPDWLTWIGWLADGGLTPIVCDLELAGHGRRSLQCQHQLSSE